MTAATLKTEGAAEYVGLGKSTLDKLRTTGGGPRYLKLGRAVRYRVSDLETWMERQAVNSTSETTGGAND